MVFHGFAVMQNLTAIVVKGLNVPVKDGYKGLVISLPKGVPQYLVLQVVRVQVKNFRRARLAAIPVAVLTQVCQKQVALMLVKSSCS
jgi:hypothetical protein